MNAPVIVCPDCDEPLKLNTLNEYSTAQCSVCKGFWECFEIKASTPRSRVTPKTKVSADSASCFNHPQNEAEVECVCGKLLCKVCNFAQFGKPQCVNCFLSDNENPELKKTRTLRYDYMASYAIGLTFITFGLGAPLAVYFLIKYFMYGANPICGSKIWILIRLSALLIVSLLIAGFIGFKIFNLFASGIDAIVKYYELHIC